MGLDDVFRANALRNMVRRTVEALEAIAGELERANELRADGATLTGRVRWAEVEHTAEGTAVVLYEDAIHYDEPAVIDEAWWAWADLGIDPEVMRGSELTAAVVGRRSELDTAQAVGDAAGE